MSAVAQAFETREIVVDEVFPHAPETIWKALTTGALIERWIKMKATGFAAKVGTEFAFQTTPAGPWDGRIRCEILEAVPNRRLVYSWKSGDESNAGYGAALSTIVTFTLTAVADGTRLMLVHSGFELPRNETAYTGMSGGWKSVMGRIGEIAGEGDTP
jgi:uncharacterized protein YndB with AHSA1/START domain